MDLKVLSIIEQLENYIQFRSIRFMFDYVLLNKDEVLEFIDKIYAEVPQDILIARKNGKENFSQNDSLAIYDCLATLERDLYNLNILGFSVVRFKNLKTKIDNIKQLYNTLVGR